jgi:carbonic anhydrase
MTDMGSRERACPVNRTEASRETTMTTQGNATQHNAFGADDPNSSESTANATWSSMLEGNSRFAAGSPEHPWQDHETRQSLIDGQHPDAAVLACSDSRVPPEIVFDQGLGDMFTVRTAGQIIDDAVLASLEYAVTQLHVSLIVVLGHEHCGAVAGAVEELDKLAAGAGVDLAADGEAHDTSNAYDDTFDDEDTFDRLEMLLAGAESFIVRSVGGSVLSAREAELTESSDFERVHIARTIETLVDRSSVIQSALAAQRVSIVGARYRLADGRVEVLSF